LYRYVAGNVVGQPGVEKFRSLKNAPGGKFAELVYSKPGGRDLMRAMGFVEGGSSLVDGAAATTLTLPPRAPLEPCRLAHCHIERATKLTEDGGTSASGGGGGSGGGAVQVKSS
jgi:hypothetical protein